MKIYTYWDSDPETAHPEQAIKFQLWERSWSARGWEPKLLTQANAQRHPDYKHEACVGAKTSWAFMAVGGGWLSEVEVINFALKPFKSKALVTSIGNRAVIYVAKPVIEAEDWFKIKGVCKIPPKNLFARHLRRGWETSPLVYFGENSDPSVIEHCGRRIEC